MNNYPVRQLTRRDIRVRVPASKSILNRALVLAALSRGKAHLLCGDFSEDTLAMLACLTALGIKTERREDGVIVHGCGGKIPNQNAELNVKSAGTAARFLTVALAFCGGDYILRSSKQMEKRPMEILDVLEEAGVTITPLGKKGHFPFRMQSEGINAERLAVDTSVSTQYASGILLSAGFREHPLTLVLKGNRTRGSYIEITLSMLRAFHIPYTRNGDEIVVYPAENTPKSYEVEPDVSGACYFYALSLLCRARVLVEGVHRGSMQGDMKFLDLLEDKGVHMTDTAEGIVADGRAVPVYNGFDENMGDFSDQTLTVAALAAFADSPSILRGISHIRNQECDRVQAILENLQAIGTRAFTNGADIFIEPAPVHPATIRTFNDHRVAMAFALVGLKAGNIVIENPDCCKKTFENYFEILTELT